MSMKWKAAAGLLVLVVFTADLSATPGTFRGKVVEPPSGKEHQGWLYVQGKNKMLRRVALGNAPIFYAANVPENQRERVPTNSLLAGAEVRVTAEQDEAGEWRALRIEILKAPERNASAKAGAI
jgi:hypothetical protein